MPWKERHKMDEKIRFGARYPDGEKIAELCRSAPGPTGLRGPVLLNQTHAKHATVLQGGSVPGTGIVFRATGEAFTSWWQN